MLKGISLLFTIVLKIVQVFGVLA